MHSSVDGFFNYSYLVRFLLIHKTDAFFSTFELPLLRRLVFFISVVDLSDLDDARVFNYYYLFRFFFGSKALFTGFSSRFSLGRTFYSFNIVSFFFRRFSFFPMSFLINDVLPLINKANYSYYLEGFCFTISFFDMNLFLEKKNNLALFNLKNPLVSRLIFSSKNFHFYSMLLNILKII
jgi:hypothetical protein